MDHPKSEQAAFHQMPLSDTTYWMISRKLYHTTLCELEGAFERLGTLAYCVVAQPKRTGPLDVRLFRCSDVQP